MSVAKSRTWRERWDNIFKLGGRKFALGFKDLEDFLKSLSIDSINHKNVGTN